MSGISLRERNVESPGRQHMFFLKCEDATAGLAIFELLLFIASGIDVDHLTGSSFGFVALNAGVFLAVMSCFAVAKIWKDSLIPHYALAILVLCNAIILPTYSKVVPYFRFTELLIAIIFVLTGYPLVILIFICLAMVASSITSGIVGGGFYIFHIPSNTSYTVLHVLSVASTAIIGGLLYHSCVVLGALQLNFRRGGYKMQRFQTILDIETKIVAAIRQCLFLKSPINVVGAIDTNSDEREEMRNHRIQIHLASQRGSPLHAFNSEFSASLHSESLRSDLRATDYKDTPAARLPSTLISPHLIPTPKRRQPGFEAPSHVGSGLTYSTANPLLGRRSLSPAVSQPALPSSQRRGPSSYTRYLKKPTSSKRARVRFYLDSGTSHSESRVRFRLESGAYQSESPPSSSKAIGRPHPDNLRLSIFSNRQRDEYCHSTFRARLNTFEAMSAQRNNSVIDDDDDDDQDELSPLVRTRGGINSDSTIPSQNKPSRKLTVPINNSAIDDDDDIEDDQDEMSPLVGVPGGINSYSFTPSQKMSSKKSVSFGGENSWNYHRYQPDDPTRLVWGLRRRRMPSFSSQSDGYSDASSHRRRVDRACCRSSDISNCFTRLGDTIVAQGIFMRSACWKRKIPTPRRNGVAVFVEPVFERLYLEWLAFYSYRYYRRYRVAHYWAAVALSLHAICLYGWIAMCSNWFHSDYDSILHPTSQVFTRVAAALSITRLVTQVGLNYWLIRYISKKTEKTDYYRQTLAAFILVQAQFAFAVYDVALDMLCNPVNGYVGAEISRWQTTIAAAILAPAICVSRLPLMITTYTLWCPLVLAVFWFLGGDLWVGVSFSISYWLVCLFGIFVVTRAFELNRRRLFCCTVLPYLLYLDELLGLIESEDAKSISTSEEAVRTLSFSDASEEDEGDLLE